LKEYSHNKNTTNEGGSDADAKNVISITAILGTM